MHTQFQVHSTSIFGLGAKQKSGSGNLNFDSSGVARAFPGGRVANPKSQNEEENK